MKAADYSVFNIKFPNSERSVTKPKEKQCQDDRMGRRHY